LAGLSVIIKKEIADAVSNKTFMLSLGVLMLSVALTGATSGRAYSWFINNEIVKKQYDPTYEIDYAFCSLIIIRYLIRHIKILGALVAVAYGFNAINKEHTEGSLKILLSYPIYRDQIILGKLIAGFIVITTVTIASLVIGFTLYLFSITVSFSPDLIMRFSAFTIMSVLLISGYLGMSMLFSIAFKDSKTVLLAMFLLIGLFNSQASLSFGRALSDVIYGPELKPGSWTPLNPQAVPFQDFIAKLSPAYCFERVSLDLRISFLMVFVGGKYVEIPSDVWMVLSSNLNSIVALIAVPIIMFAASYVFFTRRDIA